MALPIDQQPSQVGTYEKILTIANRIMNGGEITKEEAIELIHTSDDDTMILLAMADKIRQHFNDNSVDVCAIVNARSGKCPENCKFCAQSAHHNTGVQEYPFMDEESILQAARKAKEAGAIRFSIVTSGRNTNNPDEFNCLFCYCPLYTLGKNCGGNFKYTDKGIKNCSDCLLPHNKNNYNYIMSKFQDIIKITKIND